MEDTLQHALKLAERGFYLIPLRPGTKIPALKKFPERASRDPDQLREWFEGGHFDIGISTARYKENSALLVLDLDVKGDKNGEAELLKLECEGLSLPETCEQRTQSGGRHIILEVAEPVATSTDVVAVGIDVRSDRAGQIKYYGDNGAPVAMAPAELVALCGVSRPRKEPTAPPTNVDPERARKRAIRYLEDEAPPSIEGSGNTTGYKVACRVKDFGVGEDEAFQLMDTHWNDRCEPPWTAEELQKLVAHGYRYGVEPPGVAAPEADFEPIPEEPAAKAPTKPRGLFFEMFEDVQPDLTTPALVEDVFDHGALSCVYGETNVGKTFVTLDLAFRVATGKTWMGLRVSPGGVVYIAAEGGPGVRKRVAALRIHNQVENESVPLALVPCAIDLRKEGKDLKPLLQLIEEADKKMNCRVVLIVIDTLARATAGANENAGDDMGGFIGNVDIIRQATGAHVMIVHHTGKDTARGMRGWSGLKGAIDTEIEVKPGKITDSKQRDTGKDKTWGFSLQTVEIGTNAQGRPVTSCVVVPRNLEAEREFGPKHIKSDSTAGRALTVFEDMWMARREGDRGIINEAWRDEFVRRYYPEKKKSGWMSFDRARASLVAARRISQEGGYVSLAS